MQVAPALLKASILKSPAALLHHQGALLLCLLHLRLFVAWVWHGSGLDPPSAPYWTLNARYSPLLEGTRRVLGYLRTRTSLLQLSQLQKAMRTEGFGV